MALTTLLEVGLAVTGQYLVNFTDALRVFETQVETPGCLDEAASLVTYFYLSNWNLLDALGQGS